jgi:hypothetical protein
MKNKGLGDVPMEFALFLRDPSVAQGMVEGLRGPPVRSIGRRSVVMGAVLAGICAQTILVAVVDVGRWR